MRDYLTPLLVTTTISKITTSPNAVIIIHFPQFIRDPTTQTLRRVFQMHQNNVVSALQSSKLPNLGVVVGGQVLTAPLQRPLPLN
jgi:hypothetical protein